MSTSKNEIINEIVKNGYDYDLQVWVSDYIIQDCGHPADMKKAGCCNAGKLAGKDVRNLKN